MAKKVYLKGEEFVFSRVKGNKESTYRDGDINLTPANIGASAEGHTHDDRYYTESEINTKLNDKANSSHTHGNSDITGIDGSKITSGTIDLARLPKGALERLTVVADDTARFKLTSSNVQKGDTVKVTSTGKMYYVVDETKLSSEAGYEVYAAGTAASVPWSGVTGKPSTYTPSSHTHTKSQISDFPTSMPASDVPAWAKTSTKPTYTKAEVGLGNVDNTADANKRVDHANTASQLDHDLTFSICDGNGNVVSKEVFNGNTSKKIVVAQGGHTHGQYLTSDYDTKNCTTTFESGDSSTGSSTPPAVITSGETHKSLFNKISTAVKNVRWLLSKMGTTDISSIGNGTVTGALSTLNSNKIQYFDYSNDVRVRVYEQATFTAPSNGLLCCSINTNTGYDGIIRVNESVVARVRDNSGTTQWNVTPFSIVISKGDTVKWEQGLTSGDYTFFYPCK